MCFVANMEIHPSCTLIASTLLLDFHSQSKTTSPSCRLGHVKIITAQCVPDIVFICSWHYLETIKATISGHTERNGWCWWSVKLTMTNFYLAPRALTIDCKPFFQFKPNHNQIFKWAFFASKWWDVSMRSLTSFCWSIRVHVCFFFFLIIFF